MVEWYRNKEWNEEIEKVFFGKLKRARTQKDQYLAIQALTLSKHYPEITLKLVNHYFESRTDDYEDLRVLLAKNESLIELKRFDEAISVFHQILKIEEENPRQLSETYVDYPLFVAMHEIKSEYENALKILRLYKNRLLFPVDHFKWNASIAIIQNDSKYAINALEQVKVNNSGFKYHQDIGLVGSEYEDTINKLMNIAEQK